jgi:hypothetical protein
MLQQDFHNALRYQVWLADRSSISAQAAKLNTTYNTRRKPTGKLKLPLADITENWPGRISTDADLNSESPDDLRNI